MSERKRNVGRYLDRQIVELDGRIHHVHPNGTVRIICSNGTDGAELHPERDAELIARLRD